jgi:hypothetical protein
MIIIIIMIVYLMIFRVQNRKSYPHMPSSPAPHPSTRDGMPVFRASAEITILPRLLSLLMRAAMKFKVREL